jgi:hypothetical protein
MNTDYQLLLTAFIRIVNAEQSLYLLSRLSRAAESLFPDGDYLQKERDIAEKIFQSNRNSNEEEGKMLWEEYKQALVDFLQRKKDG